MTSTLGEFLASTISGLVTNLQGTFIVAFVVSLFMRFSFPRLVLCFIGLFGLGIAENVHAFSRAQRPMGDYVRDSPLIVIGDISASPTPEFAAVVMVREVMRGDAHVGELIQIPSGGTARYIVPREAQHAAVLFSPTWEQKDDSPVEEVYQRPDELAALRTLVATYKLPTERAQLVALQKQTTKTTPVLADALLADFARMREPQNFDVVLNSFAQLDTEHQASLLDLLGQIGDERALPLLIQSLQSPQRKVSYQAAHELTYSFPGAFGVTDAFRALAKEPATQESARYYVEKYDPALAATLPQKPPTLWQQARAKLKEGNEAAAKDLLFTIIEGEKQESWSSLWAAQELLPLLDEAGKERLRLLLTGHLANSDLDYSQAKSAVDLLRALPHQDNTASLIRLLYDPKDAPYIPWDETSRAATFALVKLGLAAKQKATAQVVERIKTRLVPEAQLRANEENLYFCQLAWLADDATWQQVMAELPTNFAAQMKGLQLVRDAARSKDEAAALVALLTSEANRLPQDTNRWIVARLGELRDSRAVEALFGELQRSFFSGSANEIQSALVAIGGSEVEKSALTLLQSEHEALRSAGMDMLRELQGEKIRPLLRRILSEHDSGNQRHALFLLGYVGTPEDLPLLLSFSDFWKSERSLQSTAASAVVNIRDRFGYDVHGPIGKTGAPAL